MASSATRRDFPASVAGLAVAVAAIPLVRSIPAPAATRGPQHIPDAGSERVAVEAKYNYRACRSKIAAGADTITFVHIDLGADRRVDLVKLYSAKRHAAHSDPFPVRFRIECSKDAHLESSSLIADFTEANFPSIADILLANSPGRTARYVRNTATRLRTDGLQPSLSNVLPTRTIG